MIEIVSYTVAVLRAEQVAVIGCKSLRICKSVIVVFPIIEEIAAREGYFAAPLVTQVQAKGIGPADPA